MLGHCDRVSCRWGRGDRRETDEDEEVGAHASRRPSAEHGPPSSGDCSTRPGRPRPRPAARPAGPGRGPRRTGPAQPLPDLLRSAENLTRRSGRTSSPLVSRVTAAMDAATPPPTAYSPTYDDLETYHRRRTNTHSATVLARGRHPATPSPNRAVPTTQLLERTRRDTTPPLHLHRAETAERSSPYVFHRIPPDRSGDRPSKPSRDRRALLEPSLTHLGHSTTP